MNLDLAKKMGEWVFPGVDVGKERKEFSAQGIVFKLKKGMALSMQELFYFFEKYKLVHDLEIQMFRTPYAAYRFSSHDGFLFYGGIRMSWTPFVFVFTQTNLTRAMIERHTLGNFIFDVLESDLDIDLFTHLTVDDLFDIIGYNPQLVITNPFKDWDWKILTRHLGMDEEDIKCRYIFEFSLFKTLHISPDVELIIWSFIINPSWDIRDLLE